MHVDVKKIIQELVVPELKDIKAEIATMKVEIKRLDEKIDGSGKRLDERLSSLDEKLGGAGKRLEEKMDGMGKRLDEKMDSLREEVRNLREEFHLAIDIHERLASLEAKIGR